MLTLKAVFVKKLIPFPACPDPAFDANLLDLFHGSARRKGTVWDDFPLRLDRNAYRIPDIFATDLMKGGMVVSAAVQAALSGVSGVDFLPVQFDRLYYLEYELGQDFEEIGPVCHSDWQRFLKKQKHRRDLIVEIGPYFEVLHPLHFQIVKQMGLDHEPKIDLTFNVFGFEDQLDVLFNREILEQYPVYGSAVQVYREDVFERIEPFYDWQFFTRLELEC